MSGNKKYLCRMSASIVQLLNERIDYVSVSISSFCTAFLTVFSRKLRPTVEIADYKDNEVRQILLYSGKVLLLNLTTSPPQYQHFLMLSVVCNLMVDSHNSYRYHELQSY